MLLKQWLPWRRRASWLVTGVAAVATASSAAASAQLPVVAHGGPQTSNGGEIIVQGSRDRSPYRLPENREGFDPQGAMESVLRERTRWMEGGESGIGSCSNIGPAGMTGCDITVIERAYQQGRKVGIGRERASAGLSLGKVWLGTGSKP